MFITLRRHGYANSGQYASGRFLLLVQPEGWENRDKPFRALVRYTSLTQCGHFMMGVCRAYGHRITVSGAYGGDGLPCSVPDGVWQRATPVPDDLIAAWNTGGGWNSVGSEATAMREWALRTFPDKR